jgi:DNA polymerase
MMQLTDIDMSPAVVASAMAWWSDAGVDTFVNETPRDWLSMPAQPARAVSVAAAPQIDFGAPLPATLEAFLDWFATSADVFAGAAPSQRVRPAGDPNATLMVLIDMPEPEDAAAGHLLAGECGDLFDKMLGALKLDRSTIWFAPMMPTRVIGGPQSDAEAERIAEIARHHVRLVAPKKLWLLGRAASRSILGMDEAAARGRLHFVNQDTAKNVQTKMDVIASVHPKVLLQMPKRKAEVWSDMQKLFEV